MQKVTRNVRDLAREERRLYEAVLGESLRDNQLVVLEVHNVGESPVKDVPAEEVAVEPSAGKLPDWCDVYAGLSDEEIAEVESVSLRRSEMSRPC
jgi:hypothetical protein